MEKISFKEALKYTLQNFGGGLVVLLMAFITFLVCGFMVNDASLSMTSFIFAAFQIILFFYFVNSSKTWMLFEKELNDLKSRLQRNFKGL